MPGLPRRTRSKLPLLHSCPGGVRKSTLHGPWQIQAHHKARPCGRQEMFKPMSRIRGLTVSLFSCRAACNHACTGPNADLRPFLEGANPFFSGRRKISATSGDGSAASLRCLLPCPARARRRRGGMEPTQQHIVGHQQLTKQRATTNPPQTRHRPDTWPPIEPFCP